MRVIVNGLAALKAKTGVGHYTANLCEALARQNPHDRYTLFPGPVAESLARRFPRGHAGGGGGKTSAVALGKDLAKHLAKTAVGIHFARTANVGYDLYFEPNFIPFSTALPTAVTVHDLSVLVHPQFHPADRVRHHERHFRPALRRADLIVVISRAVQKEILIHTDADARKIVVVPNGVGREFRPQLRNNINLTIQRLNLPGEYFLCVGTVEPRKNLLTAMRAFAELPAKLRERCPLVLAGPWGWRSTAEREFFDGPGRAAGIRHAGYIPAGDLPAVYAGAKALLFPSLYEGFGLPPVEMLAVGGGVLASRECEAVHEVVGDAGEFLPAYDIAAWREKMQELIEVPDVPYEIIEKRLQRAALYSWHTAAVQLRSSFEKLLPSRSRAA
jgi:glycosyltransferase involved in cell wall biosynthesis